MKKQQQTHTLKGWTVVLYCEDGTVDPVLTNGGSEPYVFLTRSYARDKASEIKSQDHNLKVRPARIEMTYTVTL